MNYYNGATEEITEDPKVDLNWVLFTACLVASAAALAWFSSK